MQASKQFLIHEFLRALQELCRHYGDQPTLSEGVGEDFQWIQAAQMGFVNPLFRGNAVLLTDAAQAEDLGGKPHGGLPDWLGELDNQLVGRFKNKLSEYGYRIKLGLPVTIQPNDVDIDDERHAATWTVAWENARLVLLLNLELESKLTFRLDPESASAEEGSVSLF